VQPIIEKPTREQTDELVLLNDTELQLTRELAKRSTWFMATLVLWPDVAYKHYYEPFHRPICDKEDALEPGGKLAVRLFREGRKSMLLNIARSIRYIVNDPNIRLMMMTRYLDTAEKICALVIEQFQKNLNFKRYFPEMWVGEGKFGKADEFTHPKRNVTGLLDPTYFATYLGAPLISRRADVLLMDDLVDEDDFKNPEIASKTLDKWTETIPLVDKTSAYNQRIFIGTPKSYNDPLAAIFGLVDADLKDVAKGWQTISRAALENANGEPDIKGEPVLPIVHTRAGLMETLEDCKRNPAKGESYFWREYLVTVQAPGDRKFEPAWLQAWCKKTAVAPSAFTAIALDSATKDEQVLFRGDFTVLLCGQFDTFGNLYLLDGARSNGWKSADLKRELLAMMQRNSCHTVIKEKVGEGAIFGQMREWAATARQPLSVIPIVVRGQGKKYTRIVESLQGPLQARKVWFVDGFPKDIHQALVDELLHLGQWSHDDIADALSLFMQREVRVQPQSGAKYEWKSPMARYAQVGTQFTNPGLLAHRATRAKEDLNNPNGVRILDMGMMMNDDEPPWFKP
jgi:hypothetical protein